MVWDEAWSRDQLKQKSHLVPSRENLSHTQGWGGLSIRLCTVQKEPRRKGKVFQGRGEGEGERDRGGVEKNVKGGQQPAVAPNKESSDRPKAQ